MRHSQPYSPSGNPVRSCKLDGIRGKFLADPRRRSGQCLIEADGRSTAGELRDFRDIRHTPVHVFKALDIRDGIRHVLELRSGSGNRAYTACEFVDGDFLRIAEIVDFADRAIVVRKQDEPLDNVAYIAEAAGLIARAVD